MDGGIVRLTRCAMQAIAITRATIITEIQIEVTILELLIVVEPPTGGVVAMVRFLAAPVRIVTAVFVIECFTSIRLLLPNKTSQLLQIYSDNIPMGRAHWKVRHGWCPSLHSLHSDICYCTKEKDAGRMLHGEVGVGSSVGNSIQFKPILRPELNIQ